MQKKRKARCSELCTLLMVLYHDVQIINISRQTIHYYYAALIRLILFYIFMSWYFYDLCIIIIIITRRRLSLKYTPSASSGSLRQYALRHIAIGSFQQLLSVKVFYMFDDSITKRIV